MKIVYIAMIFILLPVPCVQAECSGDTCIDVNADQESNQVVITVKKGRAGGSQTSSPRPQVTSTSRRPWIPWLPKPLVTRTSTPRPMATRRPRVRTISGSQISDQVKRLLPTGIIITQPLQDPLVHEPVNFMTTVPSRFSTVIVVLRIPITIHLTALYNWDFGDGATLVTRVAGAPYPAMINHHEYSTVGDRKVTLTVRWSGTWSAGAITGPINGSITQRFNKELTIRPAKAIYIP